MSANFNTQWLTVPITAITTDDLISELGDEWVTRYYGIHLPDKASAN